MSVSKSIGTLPTSTTDNNVDMNVINQANLKKVGQTFPTNQSTQTVYNYASSNSAAVPSVSIRVTRSKTWIEISVITDYPVLITDSVAGTELLDTTGARKTEIIRVPYGLTAAQVVDLLLAGTSLWWPSVTAGVPAEDYIVNALAGASDWF
jgi:hypothetical protein